MRLLTIALLLAAAGADAQNALGDGRALDNSLNSKGRLNNVAPNRISSDIRFRNAVVTGNAPAGMSFRLDPAETAWAGRPDVYFAPSEFRGDMGANDLFTYRRDTLYSGLAGQGIRGIEALQYQWSLTTGTTAPTALVGGLAVPRIGGADTGAPLEQRPVDDVLTDDDRGSLLYTLRSTAAFNANRQMQPALIALRSSETGDRLGVTASSLRGIRLNVMADSAKQQAITNSRRPDPLDSRIPDPLRPELTEDAPEEEFVQSPYDDINSKYEAEEWATQLETLQEQIAAFEAAGRTDEPEERERVTLDPATLELIREATPEEPVETFAVGAGNRNVFAEHMNVGERLLREKRYFAAEERFTRALAIRPTDPTPALARMHAQIGAGMYRSAASNLMDLLIRHPEGAAVRYTGGLIPDAARCRVVAETLRTRLDRNDPIASEASLLLAYLGYQHEESTWLRDGLEGLDEFGAPEPASAVIQGRIPRDGVVALINQLWTN